MLSLFTSNKQKERIKNFYLRNFQRQRGVQGYTTFLFFKINYILFFFYNSVNIKIWKYLYKNTIFYC